MDNDYRSQNLDYPRRLYTDIHAYIPSYKALDFLLL